jgi:hypothetical protein
VDDPAILERRPARGFSNGDTNFHFHYAELNRQRTSQASIAAAGDGFSRLRLI